MVRQGYAPSAADESFMPTGTRFSMSSVVRSVIGIARTASDSAPASAEKCPMRTTMISYTNNPMMIDGALSSTSLMKRIIVLRAATAAVFGEVGAGQHADRRADQDAEQRHHRAAVQRIEQPALAARRRRHLVNKCHDMPAMPCEMSVQRMAARQASPPRSRSGTRPGTPVLGLGALGGSCCARFMRGLTRPPGARAAATSPEPPRSPRR